jgi:hypothetical protein
MGRGAPALVLSRGRARYEMNVAPSPAGPDDPRGLDASLRPPPGTATLSRMKKLHALAFSLLALACGCGSLVKNGAATTGSAASSTSSTGGAGGTGGTGGAPAAVVQPVTMVKWPGQMVLDGDSLVMTSLDRDTGIGSLLRVTLGSWAQTTLAGGASGMSVGYGLTADAQQFYFFADDGQGNAAIYSLPRAGGTPTKITDAGQTAQVISGGVLAVDATRVYWTALGVDPTQAGGTVQAAPLAGGTAATLVTVESPDVPSGGLAVDATSLYWTTNSFEEDLLGSVYSMPVAGGPRTMLLTDVTPVQIIVDGDSLYVLDEGSSGADCAPSNGDISRVPLQGGTPEQLGNSLYGALAFAIAGSTAYVGTSSSCSGASPNGTIVSLPLDVDGGTFTTLARGPWQPTALVIDGASIYSSEDSWPGNFPSLPGDPYGGGLLRVPE